MMNVLRHGIVVATHPEDHSVDLVMLDNWERVVGAQVLTQSGSGSSGMVDMPAPPVRQDKWDVREATDKDQIAVVGYLKGGPVVMGYLFPQINQTTFSDAKRRFDKHQSGFYSTISGTADFEMHHPSGAFIRIAEHPEHESLDGKNFDGTLKTDENKDRKATIRIGVGDAYIQIDPGGTITIHGSALNISGAPITTDTRVVSQGVNLVTHVHRDVQPGGGLSGIPVPDGS